MKKYTTTLAFVAASLFAAENDIGFMQETATGGFAEKSLPADEADFLLGLPSVLTTSSSTTLAGYGIVDAWTRAELATATADKIDLTDDYIYTGAFDLSGADLTLPLIGADLLSAPNGGLKFSLGRSDNAWRYLYVGSIFSDSIGVDGPILTTSTIDYEGVTSDAFETKLGAIDPTADNIINLPDAGGTVLLDSTGYTQAAANSAFATAAQGTLADSATQPGDNISTLTNNSGYLTTVDLGDSISATDYTIIVDDGIDLPVRVATDVFAGVVTAAEHALINSATQLGDSNTWTGTNNFTNLGDLTFKTGAQGGTVRTGTANSDKFKLQAYDVDDSIYRLLIEADAGNEVTLQAIADYWHFEDATDTTKRLDIDLSGATTATTATLVASQTFDVSHTLPDVSGILLNDATGASAAQGILANSATQPEDLGTLAVVDAASIEINLVPAGAEAPTIGDVGAYWGRGYFDFIEMFSPSTTLSESAAGVLAVEGVDVLTTNTGYTQAAADIAFATAAQGTLADSAVQPGDNVSDLFNDLSYIDGTSLNGSSVDSGLVAEAYIDPTISRDSELSAALNNQSFTQGLHFSSAGSAELGAGMFDLGLSDFSIILKLKLADYTPAAAGILLASHTSGNNRLSVTLEADGDWRLSFTDGAASVVSYDITPSTALTDDSAYLFIIDLDRSANATLYVDGSSSGTVDISAEAVVDLGSGNSTQGDLMVDANLSGAAAGLLLTNFSLSVGDVAELSAVGPSLWYGFSPELRWAGSTGPTSGVYSKLSGTGTISSATISSFDVDAGAASLALNHTGSFGIIKEGQALRVNLSVSGDLGTSSVYVVSGSDVSPAVSLELGTVDYLITAPARLLYTDVRFTTTSVGGMSVAVNSIEIVGLRAALNFDEGIGYQLRDTSSNNYDGLLSLTDVYHISPAREGYVRDFAVDAYNGGTGNKELVSSTRNILPAGAILTGAEVKNNTGTITAGLLDLKRSSRTLYDIVGDNGQGLSGGQQTLIVPNESIQTSSYLNVALDGSGDADATSLDLRVNYKLID